METAQQQPENVTFINAGPEFIEAQSEGDEKEQFKKDFGGRTEQQILAREGIKVQLGGKEHEIRPAVIRVAREWGKRYAKAVIEMMRLQGIKAEMSETFAKGLEQMLAGMPDEQAELVFLYASEINRANGKPECYLPKDEIECSATAEEMAVAFTKVVDFASVPLRVMASNV